MILMIDLKEIDDFLEEEELKSRVKERIFIKKTNRYKIFPPIDPTPLTQEEEALIIGWMESVYYKDKEFQERNKIKIIEDVQKLFTEIEEWKGGKKQLEFTIELLKGETPENQLHLLEALRERRKIE